MKEGLIGIDSCGTNMKVAVFSIEGKRLYITSRKNIPVITKEGYYFDWKYQKGMYFEMLKEVVDHDYKILSIGISTCGESVYPMDEDGNIIDNAIAWYCRRTEEQKEEFEKKISEKEAYKICFLRSFYSYSAHKINWYKKYKPKIFKKTVCWLPVTGFINYLLTKTKYFDYNQAGTTLLFDTIKKNWSNRLFKINEISKDTFPELIESGKMTGFLTEENKELLGINYDIPVSIGGHDGWCGQFALGVGVSKEADEYIFSFTGTAGSASIGKVVNKKELENILDKKGIEYFYDNFSMVIPHVYPGKYYCVYTGAVVDYYGALLNFIMSFFYNKKAGEITDNDYIEMRKEIDSSKPGANGVRVYVKENDPIKLRDLDGINILNLGISNTRGDVFRAVLEYLCLIDRNQLKRIGERRKKTYVVGGFVQNKNFMRIRANILNMPQYIAKEEEINALGAALLGGVGAGIYKGYEDSTNRVGIRYKNIVKPDPKLVKEYKKNYNFTT